MVPAQDVVTGAVGPAAEGRNTMVSAERLRLDEADTGGVPRPNVFERDGAELASPGLFANLGPWPFHLIALQ